MLQNLKMKRKCENKTKENPNSQNIGIKVLSYGSQNKLQINFLFVAERRTKFRNEVQCIRSLTFSVLRLPYLFSLIRDLIGLCLLGVCAL
jgi:hypothetical protein